MDYKLFFLIILINLYTTPISSQIWPAPYEDNSPEAEIGEIPDPSHSEDDDYDTKFQELIKDFDSSMENMNPDDIITFSLKQGSEEVKNPLKTMKLMNYSIII